MVRWKNSSSIRSELTKRREGRRRSSFPNLLTSTGSNKEINKQEVKADVWDSIQVSQTVKADSQNSGGQQAVTWLVDWGSVSGCVVPASPGTGPAGSLPVLDLSDPESLWRRRNTTQMMRK